MARQPRQFARQGAAADLPNRVAVDAYVGPGGEPIFDGERLRIQDGVTPGGIVLARLDDAAGVPDGSVTNAKLADVPTSTLKGRAAPGTGAPGDLTADQVRAIIATDRMLLVPATALPAQPHLDITLPAGYDEVVVDLIGYGCSTTGAGLNVLISTDGTNFPTTGYKATGSYEKVGDTAIGFFSNAAAASILTGLTLPQGGSNHTTIRVRDYATDGIKKLIAIATEQTDATGVPARVECVGLYDASTAALQKVRLVFNGGTSPAFASGVYRVTGVKKN